MCKNFCMECGNELLAKEKCYNCHPDFIPQSREKELEDCKDYWVGREERLQNLDNLLSQITSEQLEQMLIECGAEEKCPNCTDNIIDRWKTDNPNIIINNNTCPVCGRDLSSPCVKTTEPSTKKITADEMWLALGYEKSQDTCYSLIYKKDDRIIEFIKEEKGLFAECCSGFSGSLPIMLSLQELKAIHKTMQETLWI